MSTALTTIRHISSVIKKFEFKELENAVMPNFPEISWHRVRSELVKNHKSFTTTNAVGLIEAALIEENIQERVLKSRLSVLELIDVSRHHRRKMWHGHLLTGNSSMIDHPIGREIRNNIKDDLRPLDMDVEVKLITHNGITYVALKEQKRKTKTQRVIPIFFALFLGQKYFFCSKKNVSISYVRAITNSLGYKTSRSMKLTGRDLGSLSKLCWRRRQGALNPESIDKAPVYRDAAPVVKNTGVDFTQYKQRRKYAEKFFGDDPPTLESLVVNGPNLPWTNEDISSKLHHERMNVTWEFRSHNIPACLTKLIERRIITTPVPDYISNFMTAGKNEFTVRSE